MDDLIELNRMLARLAWGRLSDAEETYLRHLPVCLGRIAPRADELRKFLNADPSGAENPLGIIQGNRAYLEYARLAGKDILAGKHVRLVETGFDWEDVQFLAQVTNLQIRTIAAQWNGAIYRFIGDKLKAGSALAHSVGKMHATVPLSMSRKAHCTEVFCPGIPRGATADDPQWSGHFYSLARAMAEERAKTALIENYTGLSHRKVSALFREIHNTCPEGGPAARGSAEFYVNASGSNHQSGPAWNVQGTIFLSCYQHLLQIAPFPLNRGWLLAHAYQSYKAQTERLHQETGTPRLTINHAYSLLAYASLESAEEYAHLATATCGTCHTDYLVLTKKELDTQQCPICHMANSNAGVRSAATSHKKAPSLSASR
ncbi:MAG: flagellar transcriptional regulator FlhC [Sulfuritalea sp.]|nr:flagellar transcriptional regulator FlhC [Sulfuritalea sp.]